MNTNYFWGELTDVSAKKEALAVAWRSKLQTYAALSTTEAEVQASVAAG